MKRKASYRKGQWIQLMLFLVIGGICGFVGGIYIGKVFGTDKGLVEKMLLFALFLLMFYFVLMAQIVVHEMGHFICGLISGYHFSSFRIGSFMFLKKEGRLTCKRYSLMGTGGQCLMDPPDTYEENMPYLLYNLGGSLTNGIAGILAFGAYFLTKDYAIVSLFFSLFGIVGLAFALINGIPMDLEPICNDGYNALHLGKNQEAKRSFWIQMRMNALIAKGARLKDMPEEWFVMPSIESLKNTMCASLGVFACNRAMDQMDFKKAKEIGDYLLEHGSGMISIHRNMIIAEMIFCELVLDKNIQNIDALYTKEFKRFLRGLKTNPSIIRMHYAYELLYKHNEEAANKYIDEFEKVSKVYPYPSEIEGEKELIDYVSKLYADKIE